MPGRKLAGGTIPAEAARPLPALLSSALGVPAFSGGPLGPSVAATRGLPTAPAAGAGADGAVAGVSASGGGRASDGGVSSSNSGSDPGLGPLGHGGEAAVPILLALLATLALLVRWELRRR